MDFDFDPEENDENERRDQFEDQEEEEEKEVIGQKKDENEMLQEEEEGNKKQKWEISKIVGGRITYIHIKQALKLLLPREYIACCRQKHHWPAKYLPGNRL